MISLQKFSIRDIVFLAITAAGLVIVSMITVPFVLSIHLFGIRTLVTAPFYTFLGTLALMKVKKPGALFISGSLNGLVLLMMSPIMFFMQAFGSFFAEILVLPFSKTYENALAAQIAATLYVPLTLPFSIIFNIWLTGASFNELIQKPLAAILVSIGTIVLSVAGSMAARKAATELKKAGKF